jgi:TM2 domain-containing membrane protein YozV
MSSVPYPNAQAVFYQQYEAVRRDEVVGILMALFLGTFGIHHFYLRRTGLGILYCVFCWTSIPTFLGFVECFFMPARVREFNAIQAAGIAAALGIPMPGWGQQPINVNINMPPGAPVAPAVQLVAATPQALSGTLIACPRCQRTNPPGSRFCGSCGAGLQ